MPDHDVAIVGAGPIGLLLACLLAQQGIDAAVFEARDGADHRSRAIGIHPPGIAALDASGIGAAAREEALTLRGGEVISEGRVLASLEFTARQRVLILPQHRTDALLRQRLCELNGNALRVGHTVSGVHPEGDRVRLRVDAARDSTASFVIAADGVRSGIRRLLGIDWRPQRGRGWYAMADIPDTESSPRAQLHCELGGLVESFPLPGDRRRWVAWDPHRELGDASAFTNAVRQRTGIPLSLPDRVQPTAFHARQHRASRLAEGRIVLVGDAAHETSPIGGQGMNLGWAAARRLALSIERSLREQHPEFGDYERSALRSAARAQRRAFFYMTMGKPVPGPVGLGRNVLIRMLGTAPLRGRTADMITMQRR
ncbi:FAD-dependent oxidoreductase [Microbacterium sp. A204]|uniref:FAD-dependent oxidoreductase n=1 Tax=Microbacterium sp. A204 TaxID=3457321 RepID=UPI003FD41366